MNPQLQHEGTVATTLMCFAIPLALVFMAFVFEYMQRRDEVRARRPRPGRVVLMKYNK